MMKIFSIIGFMVLTALHAVTITGQGYGSNDQDALKESLSDLSTRISVNVKSDFKTYTKVLNGNYQKNKEQFVHLYSSLPIKGATFETVKEDTLTKTVATLTTKNALTLYVLELKRLKKDISYNLTELQTIEDENLKYNILLQTLAYIENFNKHKLVATMLDGKNLPVLSVSQSTLSLQIQKLEKKVSSIEIASKLLTKGILESDIFISAAKPSGSSEVTQFAKILKDSMAKKLKVVKYSNQAKYFLSGNYEILKDGIYVTTTLSDNYNNIVKISTVVLNKLAYKNIGYKPSVRTFDESLNNGFLKSGKLFVNIGFKGFYRADGIDFVKGDIVDIVVKTNKPMCYFLIGHVLKENEKFSYVIPIGSDNRPFINQLTGDDINKNITIIDEIPISAPFGSENLQLFSSTFDKNGECPLIVPSCVENDNGYCVVDKNPNEVIFNTRGLNLKNKKFKIEQSEASISFTSFE